MTCGHAAPSYLVSALDGRDWLYSPAVLARGKSPPYPLHMILGGSKSRSGLCKDSNCDLPTTLNEISGLLVHLIHTSVQLYGPRYTSHACIWLVVCADWHQCFGSRFI
jgi:hypothetical protein